MHTSHFAGKITLKAQLHQNEVLPNPFVSSEHNPPDDLTGSDHRFAAEYGVLF